MKSLSGLQRVQLQVVSCELYTLLQSVEGEVEGIQEPVDLGVVLAV